MGVVVRRLFHVVGAGLIAGITAPLMNDLYTFLKSVPLESWAQVWRDLGASASAQQTLLGAALAAGSLYQFRRRRSRWEPEALYLFTFCASYAAFCVLFYHVVVGSEEKIFQYIASERWGFAIALLVGQWSVAQSVLRIVLPKGLPGSP